MLFVPNAVPGMQPCGLTVSRIATLQTKLQTNCQVICVVQVERG